MSPETYTIEKVSPNVREVPLEHGTFKSYGFTCVGREGVFSLLQKPDSAPPKPGDTFQATVKNTFTKDDGTAVVNLKKVQQQQGGGGNNRPRDPAERESIERQVAAKCATDLLVAGLTTGQIQNVNVENIAGLHRGLAAAIAEGIKG